MLINALIMKVCNRKCLLRPMRGLNSSAFTLIELLVAVTILGVLAILMFPALKGVQERSAAAGCSSNLRQLASAILAYAGEHNGYLPDSKFTLTPREENWWMSKLVAGGHIDGPVVCPQFRGRIRTTSYSPVLCTYAANEMLTGYTRDNEQWFSTRTLAGIPEPASTILLTESRYELVAGDGNYNTYPLLKVGDGELIGKVYDLNSGRRGPALRYAHGGYPQAAFVDGHAEARAAPWPDEALDPNQGD